MLRNEKLARNSHPADFYLGLISYQTRDCLWLEGALGKHEVFQRRDVLPGLEQNLSQEAESLIEVVGSRESCL